MLICQEYSWYVSAYHTIWTPIIIVILQITPTQHNTSYGIYERDWDEIDLSDFRDLKAEHNKYNNSLS